MVGGAVALVLVKAVLGKLLVVFQAPAVSGHLGQNGRGRDGWHLVVTFDNGFCANIEHRQAVAVHQHQFGRQAQTHHRAAHGQQRGLQNIEFVNLFHTGLGD